MAVNILCIKEMVEIPMRNGAGASAAQIPNLDTAVVLEVDIGDVAAELPAGTAAIMMHETDGAAFRFEIGGSGVTVPAAPNAKRWTSTMGLFCGGARGGQYIITAAA